jgi:phosphoribosylglycinamide formyltransferase 1
MNIGILISGRGSNMLAIAEAIESGDISNCKIAIIISDKADAAGLQKAAEKEIETLIIERKKRSRDEHDVEIIAELKNRNVDLICLAGYMRLLSSSFIRAFPNRIINIHPSLLPAFPGLDAQRQALEHGVKLTGCTVHFVDEGLDSGAIVAQKAVPVFDSDTEETLSTRILKQEHALYVESLKLIVKGNYRFDGRRVLFDKI